MRPTRLLAYGLAAYGTTVLLVAELTSVAGQWWAARGRQPGPCEP